MVQAFKDAGAIVKRRRRSITISRFTAGVETRPDSPGRSKITGWNSGMSRRIGNYIENFRQDFSIMATLTYGKDYPRDGQRVKAHLRAFVERLRRREWFADNSLVWFLEFQERGAPHFHFLGTGWISKNWVAQAWAEITGGDARSCSRVEALRNPDSAGAYARKYAMKTEQKCVPSGFEHIGRMWGCCGNKICKGMPRQPVVVAATSGALPHSFKQSIKHCQELFGVRLAETLSGYVIYGTTEGIERSWRYLREGSALHVLTDNFRASTLPETAGG